MSIIPFMKIALNLEIIIQWLMGLGHVLITTQTVFSFYYNQYRVRADGQTSIEEYTAAVNNGALSTFAILKDGKWTQRDYDQPEAEWDAEFGKLYSSLQGDVCITIVDCHV